MNLSKLTHIYFLGIGGIGMSALARFFAASGKFVSGYDKTKTALTTELQNENINIHFDDNIDLIPIEIKNSLKENVLIVWTPAVPIEMEELTWLNKNGYTLMKRAQVLGIIAEQTRTIAVAGTHGKSTTTTLIAHILKTSGIDCSAFMGGISGNYNTNLLLSSNLGNENIPLEKNIVVVEADEYDRSFLWLHPAIAVVTSVDADHLDIYGDESEMKNTYREFMHQVKEELVTKNEVLTSLGINKNEKTITYSILDKNCDSFAENIKIVDGYYVFDFVNAKKKISAIRMGLPGRHNVENATAAISVALLLGADDEGIQNALTTFKGVKRRFDYRIRNQKIVFIDDYGHHPAELKACISSVKELYPSKKITGVFQPHLYSRTRDFANEFAASLDLLDEVILLEIYPAREKPIQGISSSMLLNKIHNTNKFLYSKDELINKIKDHNFDVLITMGAGDIDQLVEPLENKLREKYKIEEVLS
ncbi:UDP-N-acetylmuramate--L-alanine ligase [soil metagenome]